MFRRQNSSTVPRTTTVAALVLVAAVAAAPWVGPEEPARAATHEDAVTEWNRHALDALVNPPGAATPGAGQPPPVAVQHLAMVHGAVYDAVNAIDGGHRPYLAGLRPADPSASTAAAAATAAHDVLVGIRRGHKGPPVLASGIAARLQGLWEDSLARARSQDGTLATEAGIAAGQEAAAAMLKKRAHDGRYGSFRFEPCTQPDEPCTEPGAWEFTPQPTPESPVNDPNAWVADVKPFTLGSDHRFRTEGPLALSSDAYAEEYQEVKDYGSSTSTLRTPEQTALARFYVPSPVEMFNRAFRAFSAAEELTVADRARLFAMLNMAGADALINCWDDKAHWSFWRPITAIRHADDGNPDTATDTAWTSLIPSPPYPEHPSGYNCVTSALMHTAEGFFGAGPTSFVVVSGSATRHYTHFRDVVRDTVDARVWLGIHFRSADEQGAELGRDVARWVRHHYFQPVR